MRENLASILKLAGEKRRAIDEYENLAKNYENNRLYEKEIKALNAILSIDPAYPRAKERMNELSKKTLFSERKEKGVGKEVSEKEIHEKPGKEYSETVNDGKGLEEIEKLLKQGQVEEAIDFLEGKEGKAEKATAKKINMEDYEGKTTDIKPKLRVKDSEEKTEGFFDLGAVLKGEMEPPGQNGNKGKKKFKTEDKFLEEIFANFKDSVDKEVGSEDYNTHYNLGLAYMEMELFEDAIKERDVQESLKSKDIAELVEEAMG